MMAGGREVGSACGGRWRFALLMVEVKEGIFNKVTFEQSPE